jgi:hypothetical protein
MKVVYIKFLNNTPFYVGEGSLSRADDNSARNKLFKDVRGDQHLCTLVVSTDLDKTGAVLQEQGFIRWFGQRTKREGPLTNILPYGDSSSSSFHPLDPKNFDEEREKLRSQRVSETRLKKIEEGTLVGLPWWTDGKTELKSFQCPKGWKPGRLSLSDSQKQKCRDSKLGRTWWNNGTETKLQKEQPGTEWKHGRLKKQKCQTRKE